MRRLSKWRLGKLALVWTVIFMMSIDTAMACRWFGWRQCYEPCYYYCEPVECMPVECCEVVVDGPVTIVEPATPVLPTEVAPVTPPVAPPVEPSFELPVQPAPDQPVRRPAEATPDPIVEGPVDPPQANMDDLFGDPQPVQPEPEPEPAPVDDDMMNDLFPDMGDPVEPMDNGGDDDLFGGDAPADPGPAEPAGGADDLFGDPPADPPAGDDDLFGPPADDPAAPADDGADDLFGDPPAGDDADDLFGAPADEPEAPAGGDAADDLFGAPADEPAAPAEDDADDLFGGPAVEPTTPDGPTKQIDDLFGGPPEQPAAPAREPMEEVDDLFGGPMEEPAVEETPMEDPDEVDDLFGAAESETATVEVSYIEKTESRTKIIEQRPAVGPAVEVDNSILPIEEDTATEAGRPSAKPVRLRSRTWTDNTGMYKTIGRLVLVSDTHVRLLKTNGRYTTVAWTRLSDADQDYVTQATTKFGIGTVGKLASY